MANDSHDTELHGNLRIIFSFTLWIKIVNNVLTIRVV